MNKNKKVITAEIYLASQYEIPSYDERRKMGYTMALGFTLDDIIRLMEEYASIKLQEVLNQCK